MCEPDAVQARSAVHPAWLDPSSLSSIVPAAAVPVRAPGKITALICRYSSGYAEI